MQMVDGDMQLLKGHIPADIKERPSSQILVRPLMSQNPDPTQEQRGVIEPVKEVRWEIQRYWPGRWTTAGYNIYGKKDGITVLNRVRKNQPSVNFRMVRITEVKTIEVIA